MMADTTSNASGTINSASGIAIVGSGHWGKNLTRNFHKLGVVKVICDRDPAVLAERQSQYPDVETETDFQKVLDRNDINAVVIATPAETHYDLAKAALHAGKHVFVEKPFVLDIEGGKELIELAEASSLVIMVGHVLQYHPSFIYLRDMISNGELGELQYIYSHRLNLGKIRREENILWSFAPHDISMILSLTGENPETIFATGGYYLHEEIADVTTTHLSFPSGLRAHVFVSWLHPFKEQKLVIVGEDKMAVFDDTLPWGEKLAIYPHEIEWDGEIPVANKAEAEYPSIPQQEPLLSECIHFLECIANGKTPRTDGNEGLDVLRILRMSQQSLDDGCIVEYHK